MKQNNDFNNLDFQEVRMKKIKFEVKRYMAENNVSNMNKVIDYLTTTTGYKESVIHDSIYRKGKQLTGRYLAKLEEALGLEKGELILFNEDLDIMNPLHEIKRDISIVFNTLELIDALYLVEYFDCFMKMSGETFDLLMDLSELDNKDRSQFYKKFLELQPPIRMDMYNVHACQDTKFKFSSYELLS